MNEYANVAIACLLSYLIGLCTILGAAEDEIKIAIGCINNEIVHYQEKEYKCTMIEVERKYVVKGEGVE